MIQYLLRKDYRTVLFLKQVHSKNLTPLGHFGLCPLKTEPETIQNPLGCSRTINNFNRINKDYNSTVTQSRKIFIVSGSARLVGCFGIHTVSPHDYITVYEIIHGNTRTQTHSHTHTYTRTYTHTHTHTRTHVLSYSICALVRGGGEGGEKSKRQSRERERERETIQNAAEFSCELVNTRHD